MKNYAAWDCPKFANGDCLCKKTERACKDAPRCKVGKPINGVSINGNEWLLNERSEIRTFENIYKATCFLLKSGFDDIEGFLFVPEEEE
jgi:hypothetical protein